MDKRFEFEHPVSLMTSDDVMAARQEMTDEDFDLAMANCNGEPEKYCPCMFYTGSCWINCARRLGLV